MKYKVLQSYTDLTTEKLVTVGTVVELTEERYQAMSDNAKLYGGIEAFLEEVVEEVTEQSSKKSKPAKTE